MPSRVCRTILGQSALSHRDHDVLSAASACSFNALGSGVHSTRHNNIIRQTREYTTTVLRNYGKMVILGAENPDSEAVMLLQK